VTRRRLVIALAGLACLAAAALVVHERTRSASPTGLVAVDRVADGDTIVVEGDVRVRLVQIDTPEVFGEPECFGEEASAETKRLLPAGTKVRLVRDPATDDVDGFGRLLRYVVRADGLDVNLRLVADGAAAPYFFDGVRGAHANELLQAAVKARSAGKGLWGACPNTPLAPERGVATGPA
jgi:micrococcal nuclease